MLQFDSDHTLDVDQYLLYPFDTYTVASTIRIVDMDNNATLPIITLALSKTSSSNSFEVSWQETDTFSTDVNGTQSISRDIDVKVSRPSRAIAVTMFYFAISWTLTHLAICFAVLSYQDPTLEGPLKGVIIAFAGVLAVPYWRCAMPDAPDTDGGLLL